MRETLQQLRRQPHLRGHFVDPCRGLSVAQAVSPTRPKLWLAMVLCLPGMELISRPLKGCSAR